MVAKAGARARRRARDGPRCPRDVAAAAVRVSENVASAKRGPTRGDADVKYCVDHPGRSGGLAARRARRPHDARRRPRRRTSTRWRVAGRVGLARTVPPGDEPSSSAACTSILGYDPVADYVGRGAIEAASMGIQLGAGRGRAAHEPRAPSPTASWRRTRRGHITTDESRRDRRATCRTRSATTPSASIPGVAYRHILVVKGHPELLETRVHAAARHLRPAGRGPPARAARAPSSCSTSWSARGRCCAARRPTSAAREGGKLAGHRHLAVLAGRRADGPRALRREARGDARR